MCTVSEQTLSVLTPDYWRTARRELNNPRVLAFSGLVCAMAIVLESLPIYLMGPSLKIYFSFLAVALGCSCYGSNVLLGSVWKAMLYGKGYLYYLTSGAVKNTIMLPIEVFLTWVVLNAAAKQGLDRKFIHKR